MNLPLFYTVVHYTHNIVVSVNIYMFYVPTGRHCTHIHTHLHLLCLVSFSNFNQHVARKLLLLLLFYYYFTVYYNITLIVTVYYNHHYYLYLVLI